MPAVSSLRVSMIETVLRAGLPLALLDDDVEDADERKHRKAADDVDC